jgi:predicted O-methyltransferase YrrM
LIPWELPIDVLFLDGDHSYDGCLRDFISFNSFVRRGGIIVFDDYTQENNPANGVRLVVEHILSSKNTKYKIIHKGYYSAILERL